MFKETNFRCLRIFEYTNIKEVLENCSVGSRIAKVGDERKQREVKVKSQDHGVTAYKINYLAFYCLD